MNPGAACGNAPDIRRVDWDIEKIGEGLTGKDLHPPVKRPFGHERSLIIGSRFVAEEHPPLVARKDGLVQEED
jgi:hypothetical protein